MTLDQLPNFNAIADEIDATANTIASNDIRISAHPSEYISLTSKEDRVIDNSILDLEMHAMIFDLLQLPCDYRSPLNIHCRQDGDPEEISSRFMSNFARLSKSVRNRLVLENNDNAKGVWSVKRLHDIFHMRHGIPVTFDNLHHNMLNHGVSHKDAFFEAYSTWNCTPIFHYSEGKNGTRAHKDMAEDLPVHYDKDVLFDVELKGKDYAILDILKRYNDRQI